jgi:hypothetical protein
LYCIYIRSFFRKNNMQTPPPGMSDQQFKEYMRFVKDAKGGGGDLDIGNLSQSFKQLSNSARDAGEGIAKFGTNAYRTFQDLSKSGASFSGDLIGMTAAAYNSRLGLADFSQIIKENSQNLTGLGGNVTRGAEAFARLSKSFFDDKASQELRNLGYTSKELNEVLVVQAGFQKSSFKDTEEGRKQSNDSARKLAFELDTIAKLTGKSREAQMEEMKKQQVDGRIEGKMRLLAANKSEEEMLKIKSEYLLGLAQAQANGTTQQYKEFFATGTYVTEQSGIQSALLGKQSRAMEEQVRAMQSGDFVGAAVAREKVNQEALKNASNTTINTMAAFSDATGPVGAISKNMVETTDAMYHSVLNVAKANGILLETQQDYAKALKLALIDINEAQQGRRRAVGADGKPVGAYQDVGGTARAGAALETVSQDIKAVAASFVIAGDKGKELSTTFGNMAKAGLSLIDRAKIEEELNKAGKPARPDIGSASPAERKADAEARGGAVGSASRLFDKVSAVTMSTVENVVVNGANVVTSGRSTGSLGATGKLIEDFGAGTLTMLHGKEGVITQDQLIKLASGLQEESVSATVEVLKNSVGKTGNINLDQMPKGIKTSVGDLPKVDLNSLKLPGFSEQIKANASNVAQEIKKTTPQTESPKSEAAPQKTATAAPAVTKDASLNDVVKSLESLNKQMGTLIAQNEDIGNKQISATRSKSSNIYERT